MHDPPLPLKPRPAPRGILTSVSGFREATEGPWVVRDAGDPFRVLCVRTSPVFALWCWGRSYWPWLWDARSRDASGTSEHGQGRWYMTPRRRSPWWWGARIDNEILCGKQYSGL